MHHSVLSHYRISDGGILSLTFNQTKENVMSYEEMIELGELLTEEETEEMVQRYLRELGVIPQLVF